MANGVNSDQTVLLEEYTPFALACLSNYLRYINGIPTALYLCLILSFTAMSTDHFKPVTLFLGRLRPQAVNQYLCTYFRQKQHHTYHGSPSFRMSVFDSEWWIFSVYFLQKFHLYYMMVYPLIKLIPEFYTFCNADSM